MKRIAATLLALLLVLSLSVTAFATGTGSITVKGAEIGKTYTLYLVLEKTTVEGKDAYLIPANDATVDDRVAGYKNSTGFSGLFDTTTVNGKTYVTNKSLSYSPSTVSTWANGAKSFFIKKQTINCTEGSSAVQFTGLTPGYYVVESKCGETVGTMAMISVVDGTEEEIIEKNSEPGWGTGENAGKKANGITYLAGEEISYTLTYTNATNYAKVDNKGQKVEKYFIRDEMPTGLTLVNNTLKVKVNGTEVTWTEENTDTTNTQHVDNGFYISIPWVDATSGESLYAKNPSTIEVTYKAKMGLSTTVNYDTYENKAKIWPNTNKNPGDQTQKKETVYSGTIKLNKKNNDGTMLDGAKFIVKYENGTTSKYLKMNQETKAYELVDKEYATEFETGKAIAEGVAYEKGAIILTSLKAGTYTFTEVEAPVGYALPAEGSDGKGRDLATVKLTDPASTDELSSSLSHSADVINSTALAMPETGGMGTTMFYVLGSLLAISALVFLVTQKRMRSVQ